MLLREARLARAEGKDVMRLGGGWGRVKCGGLQLSEGVGGVGILRLRRGCRDRVAKVGLESWVRGGCRDGAARVGLESWGGGR